MPKPSLRVPAPALSFPIDEMKEWGRIWRGRDLEKTGSAWKEDRINYFVKKDAMDFANYIDEKIASCMSKFLGDLPIQKAKQNNLNPVDGTVCVELGEITICGGVRQQNFDVAFRPDGPRIIVDSKSLNATKSIQKNWQNMINDMGTESATIHTRFPYAIVAFIVVVPNLALQDKQRTDITRTLERLGTRKEVLDQAHLAESISLIIWDPNTGEIDKNFPKKETNLRIEDFSKKISDAYLKRYKGLPPHD